ncbi:serine hydrolase domain-containing protein [Streptomyces sp. NPDC054871]
MTPPRTPWPGGEPHDATEDEPPPRLPRVQDRPDDETTYRRLDEAIAAVEAPDVVFALSRDGRRTVRSGGTGPPPSVPRDQLRYEIGSASKTFTALLLAHLTQSGVLSGGEPALSFLAPTRRIGAHPITLAHLITHTSGLPGLPPDFYPRALPTWRTNPYAGYEDRHVVDAFVRRRPHRRPGSRWHYSNFGVSVLGHALAAATATPWDDLLTEQVLRPLRLGGTALHPAGPETYATDATGHRKDGSTPTPPLTIGGFKAAGAIRATPHDLLTFLEAHIDPTGHPLAAALRAAGRPVLRRGLGHRHTHTMSWFQHPAQYGPLYFHCGATLGQQAFLGYRPDTATALAAVCTRRYRARETFVTTAYALLAET